MGLLYSNILLYALKQAWKIHSIKKIFKPLLFFQVHLFVCHIILRIVKKIKLNCQTWPRSLWQENMSNILFDFFFFLDKYSRIQSKSFPLILMDRWLIPLCLCYLRWLTTCATGRLACEWYRSYKHKQVLHCSLLLPLLRRKREEYSSWGSPAVYENNLATMGTALNPFRFDRPPEGSLYAGYYLHTFSSFPHPLFAPALDRRFKKEK